MLCVFLHFNLQMDVVILQYMLHQIDLQHTPHLSQRCSAMVPGNLPSQLEICPRAKLTIKHYDRHLVLHMTDHSRYSSSTIPWPNVA